MTKLLMTYQDVKLLQVNPNHKLGPTVKKGLPDAVCWPPSAFPAAVSMHAPEQASPPKLSLGIL